MRRKRGVSHILIVVQKGASNVYFSQVRSSIYLPQWEKSVDRKLVEVLEKNWGFLTTGMENGKHSPVSVEQLPGHLNHTDV